MEVHHCYALVGNGSQATECWYVVRDNTVTVTDRSGKPRNIAGKIWRRALNGHDSAVEVARKLAREIYLAGPTRLDFNRKIVYPRQGY